jgi:hypothetical protein
MSKWKFWNKVKDSPVKKRTWWKSTSVCPTCGRFDLPKSRQAKLYEFFDMSQKTLDGEN